VNLTVFEDVGGPLAAGFPAELEDSLAVDIHLPAVRKPESE
jgi:hypothetical protein